MVSHSACTPFLHNIFVWDACAAGCEVKVSDTSQWHGGWCQGGASYGGYTSMSWGLSNSYQTDTKAFLFRIANFTSCHEKQASQKFARTGAGNDIYSASGYGPTFGGGNDLLTFTTSAGLSLSCSAASYSTSGPLIPTPVSRDQSSCTMEVLLVSTDASGSAEELEASWQTDCSWSVQVVCCLSSAVSISLLLRTPCSGQWQCVDMYTAWLNSALRPHE